MLSWPFIMLADASIIMRQPTTNNTLGGIATYRADMGTKRLAPFLPGRTGIGYLFDLGDIIST
jgi:hypothetical protein